MGVTKKVCERGCVKDGRQTADEEEEWEEEPGGTDLKTRTPHKGGEKTQCFVQKS